MKTEYDWATMALFAVLAATFLQRSVGKRPPGDRTIMYLPPALGCALTDQLGDAGYNYSAVALIMMVAGYIWIVLRPGRGRDLR